MLRNKRMWIFIVLIIIIAGGGYAYYQFAHLPEDATEEPSIQTATVRQGDLVIRASGSGELIALSEVDLGFGIAGPIAELYVQVGDVVTAGEPLAVQGEREQLEAAVASDQLAVMNAEETLQDIYDQADLVAAQAMIALAQAQDALSDVEYTWSVQQEGNRASSSTIDAAEAKLVPRRSWFLLKLILKKRRRNSISTMAVRRMILHAQMRRPSLARRNRDTTLLCAS